MPTDCGHLLCERIGGRCSISSGRSRGCTSGFTAKQVAPEVFEEVRALVAAIDAGSRDAAVRLAEVVRREAREDRQLVLLARDEDEQLGDALARLCRRRPP